VWYADGSVHDTKTETWSQFPTTGFQVGMIYLTQAWDVGGLKPYRLGVMGEDIYKTDNSLLPSIIGTLIADATYNSLVATAMAAEVW
jgi:hypothetical protein